MNEIRASRISITENAMSLPGRKFDAIFLITRKMRPSKSLKCFIKNIKIFKKVLDFFQDHVIK
jgi:hypothetical protein